jgi:hypothetical protein
MTNEEFEQEMKRLEEQIEDQINSLRIKFLESEANKKPYEVKVPDDIGGYYVLDGYGKIYSLEGFSMNYIRCQYERGLAFKTKEEAEKFKKEQILLFKLHKWAEEHNGGWTPNWEDTDEEKYTVRYDYSDNQLETFYSYSYKEFSKLPYFISNDTAKRFIEEFGDEIKEVLC